MASWSSVNSGTPRGGGSWARSSAVWPRSSSPPAAGRPHFSFVKQYIHNHVVEIHGDHATGFSYLEAKPIVNGEAYLVSARYSDEYVRTKDGWRFSRMSLIPHFFVPFKEGWAQAERIKL